MHARLRGFEREIVGEVEGGLQAHHMMHADGLFDAAASVLASIGSRSTLLQELRSYLAHTTPTRKGDTVDCAGPILASLSALWTAPGCLKF